MESKESGEEIKKIVLDHPTILFFALNEKNAIYGRPITGVIVLVVQQEEIEADNICLRWEARELTTISDSIREEKKIFSKNQIVWKNETNEKLKKGTHTWYFNFLLPENYGSSFSEGGINTTGSLVPRFLSGLPLPNNPISSVSFNGYLDYFVTAFVLSKSSSDSLAKSTKVVDNTDTLKTTESLKSTEENPIQSTETISPDSTTPLVSNLPTKSNTESVAVEPIKVETKEPSIQSELPIHVILSKELEVDGLSVLISNRVSFEVTQRFEKEKFSTDKVERLASKSSYIGHSPIEIKVSTLNGGVSYRGHHCLIHLAILNGTSRVLEPISLSIVSKTTFKCQGQVNQKTQVVTTGKIADAKVASQGFYVHDLLIDLPPWLPPSLNSQLIQRSYEILVEVPVPYATGVFVSLPIVVLNPTEFDQLPVRLATIPTPGSPKQISTVEEKGTSAPVESFTQKIATSFESIGSADDIAKDLKQTSLVDKNTEGKEEKKEETDEKFEDVIEEPSEKIQ